MVDCWFLDPGFESGIPESSEKSI
jgi:hypothetical protein